MLDATNRIENRVENVEKGWPTSPRPRRRRRRAPRNAPSKNLNRQEISESPKHTVDLRV